ncbi:hypothetical protein HDU98_001589 [Podochytrium sp. JEL0797]|nr:hypothetical protein HDU98_001589 [Podochytrium sp. JEL0797]
MFRKLGLRFSSSLAPKAFPFEQHLVVLSSTSASKWPQDLKASDPFLASLHQSTSILSRLKISTAFDPRVPMTANRDILVYPQMLRVSNVSPESFDILTRYLVECRLGVFDKTPLDQRELSVTREEGPHLLVCAHTEVDCRCGVQGSALIDSLNHIINDPSSALKSKYTVYPTSHLGGHDYAANLIAYPSGNWYGNLAKNGHALSDAHSVIDACESNSVLWDHWRGQVGLDEATTKRMSDAKKTLHELEPVSSGCCGGNSASKPTADSTPEKKPETIKVTYVLQNGQRIEVDAELSEFTPADPQNPYFPPEPAATTDAPPIPEPVPASVSQKRDDQVDFSFILGHEGERVRIRAKVGDSIMTIAKDLKIPTIDGVCGGNMECATCHVIVDKTHFDVLPPPSEGEEDMLEYAIGRKDCSRLSCQMKVSKEMEGMELRVHAPPRSEVFI